VTEHQQDVGENTSSDVITRLVVVADTHVPDRVGDLPPHFLEKLAALSPTAILHAGDISTQWVLDDLSVIAPVVAVKGNRDFSLYGKLPLICSVNYGGVEVGMTHGHGGVWRYILDKIQYITRGYEFSFHQRYLERVLPDAEVIVFGHTHEPVCEKNGNRLFFNPGSLIGSQGYDPVYGILEINSDREVKGRHVYLAGTKRDGRNWVEL
jgi:uncharacterized protein